MSNACLFDLIRAVVILAIVGAVSIVAITVWAIVHFIF